MDRDEAETHYHVISRHSSAADEMFYTDGLTHEGALGHAADLVELRSEDTRGEVAAVWIAEAPSVGCPLAHGEDTTDEGESDGADKFLSNAVAQTPFWMSVQAEDPATEHYPVSITKLEQSGDEEYALELGDCMVIIKFDESPTGIDVTFPPGQLEKWQQLAYREDKTVNEVSIAAIRAAFRELGEGSN